MTNQDRDPRSDWQSERKLEPMGATARQAMWSWVATIAIVLVMGFVFYEINAKREGQTTANPSAVTAAPAPTQPAPDATTGRAPAAPQTTGRGGASDDGKPAGEGIR
jgi:hypothetical protein